MKYFVLLEQRNATLSDASLNVWNTVQHLATDAGCAEVYGAVIGDIESSVVSSLCYGNGQVYVVRDKSFARYAPSVYAQAIAELVAETGAEHVFLAGTARGRDLAPRIAMRLGAALVSDCALKADGQGFLKASTTLYAGSVRAVAHVRTEIAVYTLGAQANRPARISSNPVEVRNADAFCPEFSGWNPLLEEVRYYTARRDISESDIIVAGGRGVGGRDNFVLLESLAEALGGVVGASRSAVDEGWRPHADQIGQTGKSVAPKLYIACGISGAVQHLAGISGAGIVVAINRDREAPIFRAADYGIVGTIEDVVPRLEGAVRDFLHLK